MEAAAQFQTKFQRRTFTKVLQMTSNHMGAFPGPFLISHLTS